MRLHIPRKITRCRQTTPSIYTNQGALPDNFKKQHPHLSSLNPSSPLPLPFSRDTQGPNAALSPTLPV